MARLRQLTVVTHPHVSMPLDLSFSIGTNVLYGPDCPERRRLMQLLCGICTGDFSYTDQPIDLRCTFAVPGGEVEVGIVRPEPGADVTVTQGDESRVIDAPPAGHEHLIFDGSDRLVTALSAAGALREPRWLPPALAITAEREGQPGQPVEVNLRGIPELAGLWWHLDYERGFVTLTEPGGALDLRLIADSGERSLADLDPAQRRLVSLFLYLSCRPTPLIGASLDHLAEEARADVLRHVEPPMFGGVPRRQSFFVADSSVLMYQMALRRAEDIQQAIVVCAPGEPWRKLTDAEARKYHQYHEREFRHIDSLMRLW